MRGLAALWVLTGHTMTLVGWKVPLLSKPDLGVDLFILLSGFLMVFQYQLRSEREDWSKLSIWRNFWVRRFFRLSPLYFVLLIIALNAGGYLYEARSTIDAFHHRPLQAESRYLDNSGLNYLLHVTYIFGLIPDYAFRTPLPDWSLGLEMQFYAAFPIMMLLQKRIGWVPFALGVALFGVLLAKASGAAGLHFPMPSFLPLKLHMFIVGMLIATPLSVNASANMTKFALILLLAVVPLGGKMDLLHFLVRPALAVALYTLVHWQSFSAVDFMSKLMGSWLFRWLGELSYGAYLIHLIVVQPIIAWGIIPMASLLTAPERFATAYLATLIIVYPLAWVGYVLVEKPGQNLGRRIIKRWDSRAIAGQTEAERIAAP